MAAVEVAVVVLRVQAEYQAPLVQVGLARDASGLAAHPLKRGHQNREQQGDNGNHDQKLD